MICLAVIFIVKPGFEDRAIEFFHKATAETVKEPGCRMYLAHRSFDDPRRFFLYEQYDDRDALDFHRASPHFQTFVKDGLFNIIESRTPELYDPLDSIR